jgi:NAD(P)-dependent dehydrogenase (short-subunit alcohol dehydrogenase family)
MERAVDLGLGGKVVVVTGASKGIGLAIAQGFVREGARVVAGARSRSAELDDLAAAGGVEVVPVDLAEPAGPARLVAAAGDRIDVLVNNVGLAVPRPEGFLEVTDEMWQASITLNLMAAVRATRAAMPVMLAAGGGVIVNTGSLNARLPDPLVVDYSAAKAALVNLAKSLSKEFGPRGIRVATVDPGPVATDLWLGADGVAQRVGRASGQAPEEVAAAAARGMLTGRFTRPEEVANLVLLLASDRVANVTGADFVIDGGMIPTL